MQYYQILAMKQRQISVLLTKIYEISNIFITPRKKIKSNVLFRLIYFISPH